MLAGELRLELLRVSRAERSGEAEEQLTRMEGVLANLPDANFLVSHLAPAMALALLVIVILGLLLSFVAKRGTLRKKRTKRVDDTCAQVSPPGSVGVERGLTKTRSRFIRLLEQTLGGGQVDEVAYAALEEALLAADVGVGLTCSMVAAARKRRVGDPRELEPVLRDEMMRILANGEPSAPSAVKGPHVILVAGVNGVGKTTTVGKLAARYAAEGKKVLVVAADTFRAAAIDQLQVWADRAGASLIRQQPGGDPAAAVFDGMKAAKARSADVVLVDTAGRLHTKKNLMEELRKMRRVMAREVAGAPHEALLVLDATTGQNGLVQARSFLDALKVDGVVVTKLDGTAKGGIVLAVKEELGLPVRYVGVGEGAGDLRPFDAEEFVNALFRGADS